MTADLSDPHLPPCFIQSVRAGLVGSRQCSRRWNSNYLSTWRPCQNVRPGDIPHAAGLLVKETGRMVGVGACCHRPVKLPETGNQEALSLSLFPSLSIYHNSLPCAQPDSYLSTAHFPDSLSPSAFSIALSFFFFFLSESFGPLCCLLFIIHRLSSLCIFILSNMGFFDLYNQN